LNLRPLGYKLNGIVEMLRQLEERSVDAYVNVNNHYEGCAPVTIERIKSLL